MLVELLAGPLIGGAFLDYKTFDQEWGATVIAINPGLFGDAYEFKKNCSEFVSVIRNSRARAGEKIRMPHDRARENYADAESAEMVEIDDAIYNEVFGEIK
jgi:LDH2 family malate/lactate/ureidoglycolate dehydrogenase